MKKRSVFMTNNISHIDYVYGHGRRETVAQLTDLYPEIITADNFEQHTDALKNTEVIFATWGMLNLTEAQLEMMPSLKAVFYAAGATDAFARPVLKKNITLCSAWQANAIPVAEFCVGQILLACKGFFQNIADCRKRLNCQGKAYRGVGIYETTVALIGAGAIALKTQELLSSYNLNVIVVPSRKERRTISLEEAFKNAYVVSNHLPNRDDNQGVLNADLFRLMPHGATFINTGRGAQVNEQDLITVMRERPDLTALLDVTYPEPAPPESELYDVPNIYISSHIAGSLNNEVTRMADYMISEFKHWEAGEPLEYQVFEQMLMTN